MNKPILVSDLGKVLIDYDPYIIIEKLLPYTNWSAVDMYKFFATGTFFMDYEKGKFSEGEFFKRLRLILSISKQLPDKDLIDIWNSMFFPIQDMLEFIKFCRTNNILRLFLLSNISVTHYKFLEDKYPEIRMFNEKILSYEVGSRKPEKDIFLRVLDLAGQCKQLVFTDDREEFIYAAREVGIDAFVFRGYEDFLNQLRRRYAFAHIVESMNRKMVM